MVGLGAAQLGGERAERFGLDRGVGLLGGESGVPDEGGPAVALGGGSNRLVLGGELGDRAPTLLFAVVVVHTDATDTGHALIDIDRLAPVLAGGPGEVVLLARVSGTLHIRRLPR